MKIVFVKQKPHFYLQAVAGWLMWAAVFAVLAALICAVTQAQSSGPVNTPLLNKAFYFVGTSPYATTIQSAVTAACASSPGGEVVIPPGVSPSDTIGAVTGGCTKAWIVDGRTIVQACYSWSGSAYTNTACGNYLTPTGNGSGLTNLNASALTTGTVADARLSSNVALKNAANTFTATQTVPGLDVISAPNTGIFMTPTQIYGDDGTNIQLVLDPQSGIAHFGGGASTGTGSFDVNPTTGVSGGNSSGVTQWSFSNTNGAGSVKSLSINGSQAITGVQGSTGTKVVTATGTFPAGNLTTTDANGVLINSGVMTALNSSGQIGLSGNDIDLGATTNPDPTSLGNVLYWHVGSDIKHFGRPSAIPNTTGLYGNNSNGRFLIDDDALPLESTSAGITGVAIVNLVNGVGLQVATAPGATIAAGSVLTSGTVTVTLPVTEPDTSYTANCSIKGDAQGSIMGQYGGQTTTSFMVAQYTTTISGDSGGTITCTVTHN